MRAESYCSVIWRARASDDRAVAPQRVVSVGGWHNFIIRGVGRAVVSCNAARWAMFKHEHVCVLFFKYHRLWRLPKTAIKKIPKMENTRIPTASMRSAV